MEALWDDLHGRFDRAEIPQSDYWMSVGSSRFGIPARLASNARITLNELPRSAQNFGRADTLLSASRQNQVVVDVNHAWYRTRDLSGAILGLLGIHKAAQLNDSAHCGHFDLGPFHQ